MRPWSLACAVLLALGAGVEAHAETHRFALVVTNHDGGLGLPRLRYAARDGQRLVQVLTELGGFADADVLSLVDGDAGDVTRALEEVERRIEATRRKGDEAIFLFYYSGHAQSGLLRLGPSTLEMSSIRRRLEGSSADVRLAFVDSCGAGAIVRDKGGAIAPPFVIAVDERLSARGQVIITSSSADEVSQESDDIQGSFFTHYLATGLRGAGDRNGDGRVTLEEAYAYTYGRTVAATASSRAGAQHPNFSYDLTGTGDVVLTEPGGADVVVDFPEPLAGRYFVVDLDRQLFVAEVDKSAGAASRIALPRGHYAVKKRLDDHLLMQRLSAREKGVFVVDDRTMERVSFQDDYAKGALAVADVVRPPARWSVSIGLGAQTVVDPAGDGGLFPSLPFVSFEGRALHLLREELLWSVDLALGQTAAERAIDAGALGTLRFPVQVTQLSVGASLLWQERWLSDRLTLAGGGRIAGYSFEHRFLEEAPLDRQQYVTFTPGVVGLAGWTFSRRSRAELALRAHYLPYNVDALRHLALLDATLSLWFTL